jgi:hypothetical protein
MLLRYFTRDSKSPSWYMLTICMQCPFWQNGTDQAICTPRWSCTTATGRCHYNAGNLQVFFGDIRTQRGGGKEAHAPPAHAS